MNLTENDQKEILSIFNLFDLSGQAKITVNETEIALKALGIFP